MSAVHRTRLLLKLTFLLMLQCCIIRHTKLLEFAQLVGIHEIFRKINFDLFKLIVSLERAILDGTEESPVFEFAFDVSMELVVLGSLALEWTLVITLSLFLPQFYASITKSSLTRGAFFRAQKNFVTNLALEVILLVLFIF